MRGKAGEGKGREVLELTGKGQSLRQFSFDFVQGPFYSTTCLPLQPHILPSTQSFAAFLQSVSPPSSQGKKRFWTLCSRAFSSAAPHILSPSLDSFKRHLKNTPFYLPIIFSPPSDSPTLLISFFFNLGALPSILITFYNLNHLLHITQC